MYITITIMAVLGLLVLGGTHAFFANRRAERLAAIRREVEQDVATALRRSEEIDHRFAAALMRGAAMDQALNDYHSERTAVLPSHSKTSRTWQWDDDDVERWKKTELDRRGTAGNRQSVTPALIASLVIVAVTVTAIFIYYSFASSRPESHNDVPTLPPAFGRDGNFPPPAPHPVQDPPFAPPPFDPPPPPTPSPVQP